jgi:hypothetical protein
VKPAPSANHHGTVYFVQRVSGGPIKIGFSEVLDKRLRAIERQIEEPIRVLGTIPGSYADEARLHRHFKAQALGGEWFDSSEALHEVIRGEAWPVPPPVDLDLAAAAPDPNDIDVPFNRWHRFVEIDRYWSAGLSEYDIAEVTGWKWEFVERELQRMAKLGFLRGRPLRTRAATRPVGPSPRTQHHTFA